MNLSHIIITIHYPIEDSVPSNKRNHKVTDEEGAQKDDDVGFQAEIPKRSVLTNTKHRPESQADSDTE